jgi:Tol biopolymer transport system component/tRNA A-37 threonylcarbamoyl transferase component Bud32
MGVVWRATDTSLGRDVALKVLPDEFTRDVERLSRFEREAKLLAALNHPNIAQIYGLETSGRTRALVMELVEGPTLAERLAQGPLPVDEALAAGRQIAEALEEAHEKNIVHRDLKPQNVKFTPGGRVKVLDFGLAKAMDSSAPRAATASLLSASPTLTGTMQGAILGTAAYMAPEQAAGLATDRRADIWAFGVVLYEMLAGKPLFEGETVAHLLASVMKDEPDLAALPPATPPAVRELLRRCLRKKPRERLQAIGDARLVLEEAPQQAPVESGKRRGLGPALVWGGLAAGTILGAITLLREHPAASKRAATLPATHFSVLPAAQGDLDGFPAVSPDGRTLVYALAAKSGTSQLWLHSFDTGETRGLPGTDYAEDPFFSPDGRWLGYFARGWLRKIEVSTGLSQNIAPASDSRGGCWSEGDQIVFAPNSSSPLFKVGAQGGTPVKLTQLAPAEKQESHRFPIPLPGGKAIVYTAQSGAPIGQGIFWRSLAGGETKRLLNDAARTAFDPRGYLLYLHQGTLVGQRFDAEHGVLSGNPFPIAEHVGTDPQKTSRDYFAAGAGILTFRIGLNPLSQLRWYDRSGHVLGDLTSPAHFDEMELSRDGHRVVAQSSTPDAREVWVYDTLGKDRGTRLTFEDSSTASWAPDGRRVCYTVARTSGWALTCKSADGGGTEEEILVRPGSATFDSASPVEPLMAFDDPNEQGGADIWLVSMTAGHAVRPFANSPAAEGHARFSPDGRLIAYTSDEDGILQIYVKELDGAGSRWQLTTAGGDEPSWRADGKEMYYLGADRFLYAVPVKSLQPFTAGEPVALFRIVHPLLSITGTRALYSPAPDGQRFLVNTPLGDESEPGFRVILNWSPPATSATPAG